MTFKPEGFPRLKPVIHVPYARHGVREYWVVAIPNRTLIVHRQPTAQGYQDVHTYPDSVAVTLLALHDALLPVADLLV